MTHRDGKQIGKRNGRGGLVASCSFLVLAPIFFGLFIGPELPPWAFMWGLAVIIFVGCKAASYLQVDPAMPGESRLRRAIFLLCWPGLDARSFITASLPEAERPKRADYLRGARNTLAGLILLYGLGPRLPDDDQLLRGWLGMIGLILVLHFGVFDLLAVAYRRAGIPAQALMRAPILSESLSEFWGKRWNTAFRDLTHRLLFRPLTVRFGPRRALAFGFLASGLIHELVISWPARGGLGGPTLFFVIEGAAILLEKCSFGRSLGLGQGWRGRVFSLGLLTSTAALLFHPPFVTRVILPFLDVIGAGA